MIGDRLGLYEALTGAGPLTPRELAERTDTHERYVREWLNAQAAGGYVTYADGRYALPDEHAARCASCPARSSRSSAWCATSRDARPRPVRRRSHAVRSFLPALDGLEATLEAGVRVADVGCGDGAATMAMADAFPYSDFRGFDPDTRRSSRRARRAYRARFDAPRRGTSPAATTR